MALVATRDKHKIRCLTKFYIYKENPPALFREMEVAPG